ncbi:MAG: hypothetical protein U0R64_09210 [Candidatus Nanopelagicales bacterium]
MRPADDTDAIPAIAEAPDSSKAGTLAVLIVGTVLAAGIVALWLVVAVVTAVAAATEGSVGAWIFAAMVLVFPAWPVGFTIAGWRSYAAERRSLASLLMGLAVLPALLLGGIVWLSSL